MNNDLISREDLRKNMEFICMGIMAGTEPYNAPLTEIDNAPTIGIKDQIAGAYNEGYMCGSREAEKARPQGEWITRHKLNSFGQDVVCFECNKCGEYKVPLYHLLITEPLKVCPNCGADMRKGGAE